MKFNKPIVFCHRPLKVNLNVKTLFTTIVERYKSSFHKLFNSMNMSLK